MAISAFFLSAKSRLPNGETNGDLDAIIAAIVTAASVHLEKGDNGNSHEAKNDVPNIRQNDLHNAV